MSGYHTPVLLDQSVSALIGDPSGMYADATFGGGGHSAEILHRLSPGGRLIAFDRDSEAIANAPDDPRLTMVHCNFRFIRNHVSYVYGRDAALDGILADLGVSSHQFDSDWRGFSFRFSDSPLDMRMNAESGKTARDVLNGYDEEELEKILRVYGEVDSPRRAAHLIAYARAQKPLSTAADLEQALDSVLPKNGAQHKWLAKVYQALRIEVNDEMRSLQKFLEGAAASLKPAGRLVVITYHSLEDRMVKNFIKAGNVEGDIRQDVFGRSEAPLRAVNRKPLLPSEEEISGNTRARSAKLRIAEKI